MTLEWVALIVGLLVLAWVLTDSRQLASRSLRGTEWRPSRRVWLVVVGGGALMIIVGSAINLMSN